MPTILCSASHGDQEFRVVTGSATHPSPCIEQKTGTDAMGAAIWTRLSEASSVGSLWCAVQAALGYLVANRPQG